MKGWQICYFLTSDVANLTYYEKTGYGRSQRLQQATLQVIQENANEAIAKLRAPDPAINAYLGAMNRRSRKNSVKPIFSYPMIKDPRDDSKIMEYRTNLKDFISSF